MTAWGKLVLRAFLGSFPRHTFIVHQCAFTLHSVCIHFYAWIAFVVNYCAFMCTHVHSSASAAHGRGCTPVCGRADACWIHMNALWIDVEYTKMQPHKFAFLLETYVHPCAFGLCAV